MRNLSQAERGVINALNAHITRNEEVSLTELALECHVAKSTVVKTLQRLGYQGYQDFNYSFRLSRDVQRGALLPREVLEGSIEEGKEVVRHLSELLMWCRDKKNIIFCDGKRSASLLAAYFSRKLAMFDIFAPPSYDYAMATESHAECGLAFFFLRQDQYQASSGLGEAMLETVHGCGFKTVIFTDSSDVGMRSNPDTLVSIVENADPDIDLFEVRVIMVLEDVLSAYARMRGDEQ